MSTVISFTRFGLFQYYRLTLLMSALWGIVWQDAPAQELDTARSTQMVEIDGYKVRVQSAGLAGRKQGSPVIIMEAGLSNSLEVWNKVFSQVASAAPVVAYDRAGMGRSEWDNMTPTPQHVTARLRRLLSKMEVEPPYVLVGYSLGGIFARYFAAYYPDDIAGMVYVDPGPIITQSLADEIAPFDSVGAGREGYEAYLSSFGAIMESRSPAVKAEYRAMRNLLALDPKDRDLRAAPDVPVVVLISAKPFPPFMKFSFDQEQHYKVDVRHRIRMLQGWALSSPKGTIVVSNQTTHAIPREDPELIVWGVRRVLAAAR
jgi:pimeloyl-ACP methyl ester carboxylesterase